MEAISNPYTPGSGLAPPELAGRDDIRAMARVAIERVRRGLPAKNLLIVGLHGVGKTVLLDRLQRDAEATGVQAVCLEEPGTRSLPALLAPELRLALLRLSRLEPSKESALCALRALAGFAKALTPRYCDIEVGYDGEAEPGLADSGIFQHDLQALLEAVGTAAQRSQTALVLFIDEMQFLGPVEVAALILALHRCAQRGLPIALVGAGGPQLRARTYTEQLFDFVELGPLIPAAASQALRRPAAELNAEFEEAAVTNILAATQRHPYFLQELAKQSWDLAAQSPISLQDTRNATRFALASLDERFFRPRLDRLTRAEKKYLRAMAELGPGPHRSGEIAAVLGRPVTSLGPSRGQLISKGVIWSPSHGDTAFAVPRFDEYLRRTWPGSAWRN